MKKQRRAGTATLTRIEPLLDDLRQYPLLRETRPGVFYLRSTEILHFHEYPDAIVADVRLGKRYMRLPVTSRHEQLDLIDRIDTYLVVAESKGTDRSVQRKRHRRAHCERRA